MAQRSRPRWLFFDIGNTLVDEAPWEERYREASFEILRELLPSLSRERFEAVDWTGGTRKDIVLVHELLASQLPSAQEANRARLEWRNLVATACYDRLVPSAAAVEALQFARSRFRLGTIANQHPEVHPWMERTGLREFFELEVYDCDFGVGKPDERVFRIALEMAGCAPEEAVMIGDRLDNDIVPAKRLGMQTLWMRAFGEHARMEPASEDEAPDAVARSFHDLMRSIVTM